MLTIDFFQGFPKNGHKEKGGAAENSQREVRDKHRPTEIVFFIFFCCFIILSCTHCPSHFTPLSNDCFTKKIPVEQCSLLGLKSYVLT